MPTEQILTLLISERDKLNRAIAALGLPEPNSNGAATTPVDDEPVAKPRTFTPAQRRRQAEKMRAFWAAKRKAAGKPEKAAQAVAAPVAWKHGPMTAARKKALSLKMKAAWAKRKKA